MKKEMSLNGEPKISAMIVAFAGRFPSAHRKAPPGRYWESCLKLKIRLANHERNGQK